jgi:hypothetical protein
VEEQSQVFGNFLGFQKFGLEVSFYLPVKIIIFFLIFGFENKKNTGFDFFGKEKTKKKRSRNEKKN